MIHDPERRAHFLHGFELRAALLAGLEVRQRILLLAGRNHPVEER
jgi:hypothetical protein